MSSDDNSAGPNETTGPVSVPEAVTSGSVTEPADVPLPYNYALREGAVRKVTEAERFQITQSWIGGVLLFTLILAIVLVAGLYATKCRTGLKASDIRDFGALTVGPLITLVASLVGFYFGERRRS